MGFLLVNGTCHVMNDILSHEYIVLLVFVPLEIHPYGDVAIAGKGLQI